MQTPQLDNGYTQIANEILEQLSFITLSQREWNILMFVLRKTWGWKKKEDRISLSQFQDGCRLNHGHVCKLLKSLVYRKILLKKDNVYSFNKNYSEWGGSLTSESITAESITTDNRVVSPVRHTKETITKENNITPIVPKGQEGFDSFWKMFPNKKSKVTALRSWNRLSEKEMETAIKKLPIHCASVQWTKDNGQFIPHPATWLNQKRWEDVVENSGVKKKVYQCESQTCINLTENETRICNSCL